MNGAMQHVTGFCKLTPIPALQTRHELHLIAAARERRGN